MRNRSSASSTRCCFLCSGTTTSHRLIQNQLSISSVSPHFFDVTSREVGGGLIMLKTLECDVNQPLCSVCVFWYEQATDSLHSAPHETDHFPVPSHGITLTFQLFWVFHATRPHQHSPHPLVLSHKESELQPRRSRLHTGTQLVLLCSVRLFLRDYFSIQRTEQCSKVSCNVLIHFSGRVCILKCWKQAS